MQTEEFEHTFEIDKFPKKLLDEQLELYRKMNKINKFIPITVGLMFLVMLVFRFVLKSDVVLPELIIYGLLLIILLYVIVLSAINYAKLKKSLRQNAKKYNIEKFIVQKEFSFIACDLFGGGGVKLNTLF